MGLHIDPASGVGKAIAAALADGSATETSARPVGAAGQMVAVDPDELSEREFQARVVAYAKSHGWTVASIRPVRVLRADGAVYHETPMGDDGAGWPDLVLVRCPQIIFAELKSQTGRVRAEQQVWLDALGECESHDSAHETYLWRPSDWDEIERILA